MGKNGISPTVRENHGEITAIVVPEATQKGYAVVKEDLQPKLIGGIGEKKSNNGTQYYQQDRIYDSNAVAMCHPAGLPSGSYMYQLSNLRIRKLTPRETFRLMGVKDEDFDKIKNNQSDSSLYHLAGDSIVTTLMVYMFKNLF